MSLLQMLYCLFCGLPFVGTENSWTNAVQTQPDTLSSDAIEVQFGVRSIYPLNAVAYPITLPTVVQTNVSKLIHVAV
jgi:hypothetical protein